MKHVSLEVLDRSTNRGQYGLYANITQVLKHFNNAA